MDEQAAVAQYNADALHIWGVGTAVKRPAEGHGLHQVGCPSALPALACWVCIQIQPSTIRASLYSSRRRAWQVLGVWGAWKRMVPQHFTLHSRYTKIITKNMYKNKQILKQLHKNINKIYCLRRAPPSPYSCGHVGRRSIVWQERQDLRDAVEQRAAVWQINQWPKAEKQK